MKLAFAYLKKRIFLTLRLAIAYLKKRIFLTLRLAILASVLIGIIYSSNIIRKIPKRVEFQPSIGEVPRVATALVEALSDSKSDSQSENKLNMNQNEASNFSNYKLQDLKKSDINEIAHSHYQSQNPQKIDKNKILFSHYKSKLKEPYRSKILFKYSSEINKFFKTSNITQLANIKAAIKSQQEYDNQIKQTVESVARRKAERAENPIPESAENIYHNVTSTQLRLYIEILKEYYDLGIMNIDEKLIALKVLSDDVLKSPKEKPLPSKDSIKSKIQQLLEAKAKPASAP